MSTVFVQVAGSVSTCPAWGETQCGVGLRLRLGANFETGLYVMVASFKTSKDEEQRPKKRKKEGI